MSDEELRGTPEERKSRAKAGRDKIQGLQSEDTLHRTGVEEGIVLPTLMGWGGSLDPNDTSRTRYLEELAEELGTPPAGPDNEPRSAPHRRA